jgi:very-short-patch-repair endonuclease
MYLQKHLSCNKISKKLHLGEWIIRSYLYYFNIPLRTSSESQKIIWSNKSYRNKMIKLAKVNYRKKGEKIRKKEWTNKDKKEQSIRSKKWWRNPKNKDKTKKMKEILATHNIGITFNKEWIKSISIERKNRWKNPNYARNWNIKNNISPTFPEIITKKICKLNHLPFKFVGDGKLIISSFNPDFICEKEKKIIEVFSEYHHNLPKVKKRDRRKRYAYNSLGYKLLVIWSKKLKNPQKVTERIVNFYLS